MTFWGLCLLCPTTYQYYIMSDEKKPCSHHWCYTHLKALREQISIGNTLISRFHISFKLNHLLHEIMIVLFFSHQNIHITTRQLLFCGQWWYYLHTYMFVLSKFLCYQQTMRSAIFINDTRKVCHLKNTTYIVHTTAISPKKKFRNIFSSP